MTKKERFFRPSIIGIVAIMLIISMGSALKPYLPYFDIGDDRPNMRIFEDEIQSMTSIPLGHGEEQMIPLSGNTAVRFGCWREQGNVQRVIGNMDLVEIREETKESPEVLVTLMRTSFEVTYQDANDEIQVQNIHVDGSLVPYLEIWEKNITVTIVKNMAYGQPLVSELAIDARDLRTGGTGEYRWKYTLTMQDENRIVLSVEDNGNSVNDE